jgi:hypothetical protein
MKDYLIALINLILLEDVKDQKGLNLLIVIIVLFSILILFTIEDFSIKLFLFIGVFLYVYQVTRTYFKSK